MVNQYSWSINKNKHYANAKIGRKLVKMHRLIMGYPQLQVDHINHNRLDNRRSNLRLCTNQQNCFNRRPYSNNKCGYKGVSWLENRKRYVANIFIDGKVKRLGSFKDVREAALAYNDGAKELFGEFAYINEVTL